MRRNRVASCRAGSIECCARTRDHVCLDGTSTSRWGWPFCRAASLVVDWQRRKHDILFRELSLHRQFDLEAVVRVQVPVGLDVVRLVDECHNFARLFKLCMADQKHGNKKPKQTGGNNSGTSMMGMVWLGLTVWQSNNPRSSSRSCIMTPTSSSASDEEHCC